MVIIQELEVNCTDYRKIKEEINNLGMKVNTRSARKIQNKTCLIDLEDNCKKNKLENIRDQRL